MSPPRLVLRTLECARAWVRAAVRPGGCVLGATAGNGYGALFLASLVGPAGRVYACGIQSRAIENTRALLEQAGWLGRAELAVCSHSRLDAFAPAGLSAGMFSLGREGGRGVCAAVEAFCAALPIREALVCRPQSFNGSPDAPRLLGIQKKSLP